MKKLAFALAAVAVAAISSAAQAGGCPGPYCQQPGTANNQSLFHRLFVKQPLPAFQAAPWYLYYPYNGHFQTPAPMGGGYGSPMGGGAFTNPYFPGYGGGYGYGPQGQ